VSAQVTRTWDGGGAGSEWTTAGNWSSDDVPDTAAEAALFTNDPGGQSKPTVNLLVDVTIGQLQYSATAPGLTITGTGVSTLFLAPGTSFSGVGVTVAAGSADQSITTYEVEFLSSQTWNVGGTTTLTVTGRIEDAPTPDYALTKNGTGTLVFSGDVRYDGPTTVNAGTFVLSFDNTAMLSALTVTGGVLRGTTDPRALGNNGTRNAITLAGGALELANDTGQAWGPSTRPTNVTGNTTIRSDRLTAGTGVTQTLGTLTVGAPVLSVTAGTNVTGGTAGITFGGTTLTGNAAFAVNNTAGGNSLLTLGAVGQSGGTRSLTKTGHGTLRLNGAGNYAGGTTLNEGAITLGVANALGSGGFTFAGGTLNANNTTDSTIGALALTADSTLHLAPGGGAATLTFAGVAGSAGGILTITGWSGPAGGSGTDDKIILAGGTAPDADFLQHIHFDLGGGNIRPGILTAGGELIPSLPPTPPTVAITAPTDGAVLGAPAGFSVSATADGGDDPVTQIEFFRDAVSIGVDLSAPYVIEVTDLGVGTFVFTAVATDTQTLMATSNGVTVTVVADSDEDGMPDAWESAHGLDPADSADGDSDRDLDGVSNRDEYVFGTDPEDPADRTIIHSIGPSVDGGYTVVFTSLPDRTYTIVRTTDWSTWLPVATDLPGTGSAIAVTDHPGAGTGFFYRIEVHVATP